MIEVLPYEDESDEQLGLDVYNAVWPQDRIGIAEERSFRASLRDYVDMLARLDGDVVGSAVGAIMPNRPELVFALVTVPSERRRRVPARPSMRRSRRGPASVGWTRSRPSSPTTTARASRSRSGAASSSTATRKASRSI